MGIVLHELRLYHWAPAALHVTPAYVFLQHIARQNNWCLERDFGVERSRDVARAAAADQVREAQKEWVPNLGPIEWQSGQNPYSDDGRI
eukprot:6387413-Pyramimonas_sp.AAC.1